LSTLKDLILPRGEPKFDILKLQNGERDHQPGGHRPAVSVADIPHTSYTDPLSSSSNDESSAEKGYVEQVDLHNNVSAKYVHLSTRLHQPHTKHQITNTMQNQEPTGRLEQKPSPA
jgi:hypothetical protein